MRRILLAATLATGCCGPRPPATPPPEPVSKVVVARLTEVHGETVSTPNGTCVAVPRTRYLFVAADRTCVAVTPGVYAMTPLGTAYESAAWK